MDICAASGRAKNSGKMDQTNTPTLSQWVRAVNQVLPYERIMYEHRGNVQKYYKIWWKWNKSHLTIDINEG